MTINSSKEAVFRILTHGAGAPATNGGDSASLQLARLARAHGLAFVHETLEIPDGPGRGRWELAWVF